MTDQDPTANSRPFVSVIVPVFNRRDVVGECIDALLGQDYPLQDYEVIIVDNDSTDSTPEVIRRYPVRHVVEKTVRTSYGARNAGARCARGDLLAFCDADQIASRSWLSTLVAALPDGYAGVGGPQVPLAHEDGVVAQFGAHEATFSPSDAETDIEEATAGNVLYRRKVFDQMGGFSLETPTLADFDLSLRIVHELGMRIRYAPGAVQYHRVRAKLTSLLKHEARFGYAHEWLCRRGWRKAADGPMGALLAGLALRTAKSAAAACVAAVRAPFLVGGTTKLRTISLGLLMVWANAYGRLVFRLGRRLPQGW
jgi:glycosyltransferase involved in cell wall biosynthesis